MESSSPIAISYQTFTLFPKLPLEIQREIWKQCLPPPRLIKFDRHLKRLQGALQITVLWVCRESRGVALETYTAWGPCLLPDGWSGNLFPERIEEEESGDTNKDEIEKGKLEQRAWRTPTCPHNAYGTQPVFPCSAYTFLSFNDDIFTLSKFGDLHGWFSRSHNCSQVLQNAKNVAFRNWEPVVGYDYSLDFAGINAGGKKQCQLRSNRRVMMRFFGGLEALWMIVDERESKEKKEGDEEEENDWSKRRRLVEVGEQEEKELAEKKEAGEKEMENLKRDSGSRWKIPVLKLGKLVSE